MFDRLESAERRFDELTAEMAKPEISADYEKLQAIARERAALDEAVSLYRVWRANERAISDARGVLGDSDPEMAALARDEMDALLKRKDELEAQIKRALLPR